MSEDAAEFARLLVRRAPMLRTLAGGTTTKAALAEAHDVSRSTVDRAVRRLESAGAVERRDGGVALTLVGTLALSAYDSYRADLEGLAACCHAVEGIGRDAPVTLDLLRGADVHAAPSKTPHRPVAAMVDLVEDAVRVETYATMVLPELFEAYVEGVVDGALTIEAYVERDALGALVTDFGARLGDALDTGRVSLAETTVGLPFYLARFDLADGRRVVVVACGDHGVDYLLVNDTAAAVAWADERLAAVAADADPL